VAFKVSGDFQKKFDRWRELLDKAEVIVKHTSRAQAEVAVTLIGEGFDNESDPYGKRWAAKKTDDGRKVLHGETTRLRNGWHVASSDKGGFQVDPGVEYAAYHQEPRGNSRPQRMQVPDSRGLPNEWADEFRAVAMAEAIDHFAEAANDTKPRIKKRSKGTATAIQPAAPRRRNIRQLRRLRRA